MTLSSTLDDANFDLLTRLLSSIYQPKFASSVRPRHEHESKSGREDFRLDVTNKTNEKKSSEFYTFLENYLKPAIRLLDDVKEIIKENCCSAINDNSIGWPFVVQNRLLIVHFGLVAAKEKYTTRKPSKDNLEEGDFYLRLTFNAYKRLRSNSASSPLSSRSFITAVNDGHCTRKTSLNSVIDISPCRRNTSTSPLPNLLGGFEEPNLSLSVYDHSLGHFFHYKIVTSTCLAADQGPGRQSIIDLFHYLYSFKRNLPENLNNTAKTPLSYPKSLNRCLCMDTNGELVLVPIENLVNGGEFCRATDDQLIYIDAISSPSTRDCSFVDTFSKSQPSQHQQQQRVNNSRDSQTTIFNDIADNFSFNSSFSNVVHKLSDRKTGGTTVNGITDRIAGVLNKDGYLINARFPLFDRNKCCSDSRLSCQNQPVFNRKLWPKKIDDIQDQVLSAGCFVYTGPVIFNLDLPTAASKSALVIEIYPERLLNLQQILKNDMWADIKPLPENNPDLIAANVRQPNGWTVFCSPFDFAKTLIYLNHVHKSSSVCCTDQDCSDSTSSSGGARRALKDKFAEADCDRNHCQTRKTGNWPDNWKFSSTSDNRYCQKSTPFGEPTNDIDRPIQQQLIERTGQIIGSDVVAGYSFNSIFDDYENIFLLVDCRFTFSNAVGGFQLLKILLQDLLSFEQIDGQHSRISFVLVGASDLALKMLEETEIKNIENMSVDQLHSKIAPGQLSDGLGGERKYNAGQWVKFRKDLEKFVNCCQTAAKFYIKSMKRLKVLMDENSTRSLWSMSTPDLENRAMCIKNELNLNKNSFVILNDFATNGQSQLRALITDNVELEALPHYKEAIVKVSTFFDEVCRLLIKYDKESAKLSKLLCSVIDAKHRYQEIQDLIHWFETDARQTLQNLNVRPNGTKDAQFLLDELDQADLSVFEPFLNKYDYVMKNYADSTICTDSVKQNACWDVLKRSKMDELSVVEQMEKQLHALAEDFKANKELTKNYVRICLICYQLCDEAYEWALDCLKFVSSLKKSLANLRNTNSTNNYSVTRDISVNNSVETDPLNSSRNIVQTYFDKLSSFLANNPTNKSLKLDRMREIAEELQDERLILQCQAVEVRCFETEEMLLEQKAHLTQILHNYDSATQDDSVKIRESIGVQLPSSSGRGTDLAFSHIRRRSYAGSHSASSLRDIARTCNTRLPLHRRSLDCLIEENETGSVEPTRKASIKESSSELEENDSLCVAINQRVQLLEKLKLLPDPNAKPILQSEQDICSSVAIEQSKPASEYPETNVDSERTRLMNKNSHSHLSSFVGAGSISDLCDSDGKAPYGFTFRQRHASLETLGSLDDGKSQRSDSMSSKDSFSKCVALKNILANHCASSSTIANQEFTAKQEDSSFSSLSSSPPPFPAPDPPSSSTNCSKLLDDFRPDTPPSNASPALKMQYNVVNELLQTEAAYVRSLQYVVQNYIPEMQRSDLPHHLTGKRSIIFGNLEKLYDFHVAEFLPDLARYCLKSSENLGIHVARCFLRHKSKFHLYALYSKNKPKSDALMVEYGSTFFKNKQLALNDKMDLSSYLLKPVQRIGKYTLMMQSLLKVTPPSCKDQIDALKQVEKMFIFQLRHGNDLLAMDSIQNCDLSLKEQGQLLRQDEFIVHEGKSGKKCTRRIFLFQNLVLFTKPRRQRRSNGQHSSLHCSDVYEYKYCIMMTDVGLTERVSNDCELKFEIWFRRRTSDAVFLVVAPSLVVKKAWVDDLSRLLWKQAIKNREERLTEMTSMGIGTKVCRDLVNSQDRIQNRAVNNDLLIKSSRGKTILPSIFDVNKFNLTSSASKRPQSLISVDSSSSNSSSATNNGHNATSLFSTTTPMSSESGFADLVTFEEYPDCLDETTVASCRS